MPAGLIVFPFWPSLIWGPWATGVQGVPDGIKKCLVQGKKGPPVPAWVNVYVLLQSP